MDFILDDDDTASVRRVDNQIVCGLQVDDADVTPKRIHQVGSSPNDARPAEIIEDLVDSVVSNDVKEVLPIDKLTQSPSNQIEVRVGGLVGSEFWSWHSGFSTHLTMFNEVALRYKVSIKKRKHFHISSGVHVSILRSDFAWPPSLSPARAQFKEKQRVQKA
jgi:hypothetical protein